MLPSKEIIKKKLFSYFVILHLEVEGKNLELINFAIFITVSKGKCDFLVSSIIMEIGCICLVEKS